MVPEAGLNTGLVGRGTVLGRAAGNVGGAAADLMGAVFAVRALIKGGRDVLFTSCCVDGEVAGTVGAEEERLPEEGALVLVGRGAVLWASAFANDAADIFFVPCCTGTRGEVEEIEPATRPDAEGTAGATGPIRVFFLPKAPLFDGKGTGWESWRRVGKCVTPGGASGARFGGSGTAMNTGFGSLSVGGGALDSSSFTAIQFSVPSSRARSVGNNKPSERYSRTCFSEYGPSCTPASRI